MVYEHGCPMYMSAYECALRGNNLYTAEFILRKLMEKTPEVILSESFDENKMLLFLNLDDPAWQMCLFPLDLRMHPRLHEKVQAKKQEIYTVCGDTLQQYMLKDIMQFCFRFFI